ncbi:MAG: HIRAN domain-containing protein [Aurantimicrobium sp.]|nr:HIRAN domain-containing protein [Aurantimicrobium sp.]
MKVHPIPAEDAQEVEVVGERFYRAAMERIVGTPPLNMAVIQPTPVVLKREPQNPADANAVAVIIQEEVVGHLSAEDAAHFAPELDRVEAAGAVALVQGSLWCKNTDQGLMSNVRIKIPRDWVFDGFIDDAEYVHAPAQMHKPRSFRGPWIAVIVVVVLWLVLTPYPGNVIFALLTFAIGAFILGIRKLREQKRNE